MSNHALPSLSLIAFFCPNHVNVDHQREIKFPFHSQKKEQQLKLSPRAVLDFTAVRAREDSQALLFRITLPYILIERVSQISFA